MILEYFSEAQISQTDRKRETFMEKLHGIFWQKLFSINNEKNKTRAAA